MYLRVILTCLLLAIFSTQAWADCEIVDEYDNHPLSILYNASQLVVAAFGENTTKVAELIKNGCNLNYRMTEFFYFGETEQWFYNTTVIIVVARTGSIKTLEVLLKYPELDVNAADSLGRTAMIKAAAWGRYDAVKILHNAGADVNFTDIYAMTSLHYSALWGHYNTVLTLIELGADMNARNHEYNQTALHHAAMYGYTDTVDILIEAGADLNPVDNRGWTPLDYAIQWVYPDVQDMLEAAGAEEGSAGWYYYYEDDD